MDKSAFDSASREQGREDLGMVIASAVVIDLRTAAELRTKDDERAFEETTGLEIREEGREGDVEFRSLLRDLFLDVVVHVPAASGDLDIADPFFDETTCEQEALAELVVAVAGPQLLRLLIELERLEVGARHDRDRLFVELRVALHRGGLESLAESRVELVQHREALIHHFGRDFALGVLET